MQFQSYIYGKNHYTLDPDLHIINRHFWSEAPEYQKELEEFGAFAGTDAYEVAYHVDHAAPPILQMHDLDGNRIDRALMSPAQRNLLKKIAQMNRPPFETGSWHHHFTFGYLLADPGLYCIGIITCQTVYVIHKYASAYTHWKEKLLTGEWFGATWMTEIHAGSDLGANMASAVEQDKRWYISNGDKYFASGAGLADLAVVTARPEGAQEGPKGLALFLVPRLNRNGELNFRVRRLKNKSATRAVPTGEVELENSEAVLVGDKEKGIYYTLETLTVSRLANSIGAMGIARKAQLEAWHRAKSRTAFGKRLCHHPLLRRDLIDMVVRTVGGAVLTFYAVDAFEDAWEDRPPYSQKYHYARFLSHLTKNRTADHSAEVTRLAMEVFGGLGFLEEYPMSRWHREALITPIWEGTSNIQALDMLESIQKKHAHESFLSEMATMVRGIGEPVAADTLKIIEQTFTRLHTLNAEEAQWCGKELLRRFADAAQVVLLYALAATGGERYAKLAELYYNRFLRGEEYPSWVMNDETCFDPEDKIHA